MQSQQQESTVKWSYHQQMSFCGKPRCAKCQQKIGHGPYWYAYGVTDQGRTFKRYLGKILPPEAQQEIEQQFTPVEALPPEEPPPPVRTRIYTLGQFRLERWTPDGWRFETRASWQQQRVRGILSGLLAAPHRTIAREQLTEQLWPAISPETSFARLDRAVYDLRALLEDRTRRGKSVISAEEGVMILAPQEQIWVDADAFELLVHQAWQTHDLSEQEKLLQEARLLYSGDFLVGEEAYPVIVACRERLHREWIALLIALADAQSTRQALPEAIECLYLLVQADPLNEGAVQRLLRLLWQTGQRDRAVLLYKKLATLLKQQYHIVPLPETRALYEEVCRGFSATAPSVTPPSAATVSSPLLGRPHRYVLVGRESEREQVRGLLTLTERSTRFKMARQKKATFTSETFPQMVCLIGEIGIGKTRLAEEIGGEARRERWTVAWTRAYQTETRIPYRLWTEALRRVIEQAAWSHKRIQTGGMIFQPLLFLLPELQEWLDPPGQPPFLAPEREVLHLWEAILELLLLASEQSPLLVVLDDLHWADESSCELLLFLARRLRGTPIFFLATCREHELAHEHHHLQKALTDLQRERILEILVVPTLNAEEMEALLLQVPAFSSAQMHSVIERAGGNPYFAEELAYAHPSTDLPETIAAALELRLAQLSPACLRLLSKAAVLREAFSFALLLSIEQASSGGLDEEALLETLEEAIAAGMLVEEGGLHRFWHPLLAQHLYERLSSARRASFHRRVAEVLEALPSPQEKEAQAAQILLHLERGGAAAEQIAQYAEQAGNYAYKIAAYAEAMQHYVLAVAQEGTTQQQDMFLWERYSEAARIHGEQDVALAAWKRVLELHATLREEEPHVHGAMLIAYSQIYYDIGMSPQAAQLLEDAERVLLTLGRQEETVWGYLRWQQSCLRWMMGNYDLAEQYAQESLACFEHVVGDRAQSPEEPTSLRRTLAGDPVDIGRVLRLLGSLAVSRPTPSPQQALVFAFRGLSIFERCQKRRETIGMQCDIANMYLSLANYTQAKAFIEESLAGAERIGDRPIIAVNLLNLGIIAEIEHREEDARTYFEQSIHLTEEIQDWHYIPFFAGYYVLVLLRLDDGQQAVQYLRKALWAAKRVPGSIYGNAALVALAGWLIYRAKGRATGERAHLLRSAQELLCRVEAKVDSDFAVEAAFLGVTLFWLSEEREQAQQKLQQIKNDAETRSIVCAQRRAEQVAGQLGLTLR